MQQIVFEEPYEFIPPVRGTWFYSAFKLYLRSYLRKSYGIVADECRGIERLRESLDAGHGIILAPNHCRLSDPMSMGLLSIEAKTFLYTMASWHVFKQDWLTTFVVRRLGAFSLYREGIDRTSLNYAIDVVEQASRPLVIFPEGGISRANDRLGSLMDGLAFIARSAARRRAKQSAEKKVVIHPVALKYEFCGDVEQTLSPVLDEIEDRLAWPSQRHVPLLQRIGKLGQALLCLREIQYFGKPQPGPIYQRLNRLLNHLLVPLEEQWLDGPKLDDAMPRVKSLRATILPVLLQGEHSPAERDELRRQLDELHLAQQLACYPHDYVRPDSPPERLLETVEGFEEDLTGTVRMRGPLRLLIEVGEAIEVGTHRSRNRTGDPLMQQVQIGMRATLAGLAEEVALRRAA